MYSYICKYCNYETTRKMVYKLHCTTSRYNKTKNHLIMNPNNLHINCNKYNCNMNFKIINI